MQKIKKQVKKIQTKINTKVLDRVQKLLSGKKLTQREIATRCKVSASYVNRVAKGKQGRATASTAAATTSARA